MPGVGASIYLTLLSRPRTQYLCTGALLLFSMLPRQRGVVFAASAQPPCRLAGYPAFLLAAMARAAGWCRLEGMALRCVIVDDNQDFLRAARELLDHEGISVVGWASTGADAYRACQELKPDIVLLDIDLGDETGIEVARRLAGQRQDYEPRMILISAYSGDDFADMIADSPALSFLPKSALSGQAIRDILHRAEGSVIS